MSESKYEQILRRVATELFFWTVSTALYLYVFQDFMLMSLIFALTISVILMSIVVQIDEGNTREKIVEVLTQFLSYTTGVSGVALIMWLISLFQ